jgi:hypothetical protein
MNTVFAVLLLILGILLAFVWGINIFVQIIGWVLMVGAIVWLVKYLAGDRTRT